MIEVGERRRLGRSGVEVTRLGLGCAPLGNLFTAVAEEDAAATVGAAWDAGVRWFDTAPLYGHGLSERRLGAALAGRPRDDVVISTKVGRLLRPASGEVDTIFTGVGDLEPVFDFSADGVRRSLDESLDRLGLDRVDIALVHDPDDHVDEALAGAFPALLSLRDEGVVGAIGAGMNQWQVLDRFVTEIDLDVVLLAGRYTLLDRSGGDVLLRRCLERGVSVVLGGVFNSGVLADPDGAATYDYAAVPPRVALEVDRLRRVCDRHGVPLPAAALQFGARHPAVTAVVVGARTAAEVAADVAHAAAPLPPALWADLESTPSPRTAWR